ncbi:META domain-containing protein [Bdellovibrio bacteriovorus]
MPTEDNFAEVLQGVDNYTVDGDNLSLNKARMAPLARFKAVSK